MSADTDNQPYDNVEFPIRRPIPGTGGWFSTGMTASQREALITGGPGKERTHTLAPVVEGGLFEEDGEEEILLDEQMGIAQTGTGSKHSQGSSNVIVTPPKSFNVNHVSTQSKPIQLTTSKEKQLDKSEALSGVASMKPPIALFDGSRMSFGNDSSKPEGFTWSAFTPLSHDVFENAYTRHKYFYKLSDKVLKQGTTMKYNVWDVPGKPGETMTYEQLLQGVLVEGEKLLLGGSWVYFQDVEFFESECSKQIKPALGEGRICLTNLRMLLMCAEMSSVADISEYGNPSKNGDGGYKLAVSKLNNVYFQNIPIDCFESVELSSAVGTMAETKLIERKPACCGLFACVGIGRCGYTWDATPPLPVNVVKRIIRLGVYLPPWRTPAIILVHLHPKMSLTSARDFVTQLQNHVPQMQYHYNHGATVL